MSDQQEPEQPAEATQASAVLRRDGRPPTDEMTPSVIEAESLAELMLRFEAIGMACDFGVVQRCCGAEPLGLFRFTGSSISNLVTLLETSLDGFLTADDLGLEVRGQEYMSYSRRFDDFFAHTNVKVENQDAATVAGREIKKAAYLKRRFEQDWKAATRIYVHCGSDDAAAILRLHAVLRQISNCVLLWVVVARNPSDRGRVEVCRPGLLRGYLGHCGTFGDQGPRLDLPAWVEICRSAAALTDGVAAPPRHKPLRIQARFAWASARWGDVVCDGRVALCRVLYDATHAVPAAELTVAAVFERRRVVVISVWVRLSSTFRGGVVMLNPSQAMPINYHTADPTLFDTWQQIWTVMKVADTCQEVTLSLEVEAMRSSEIVLSGWQLQEGGVPDERLRPDEHASRRDRDELVATTPVLPVRPGRVTRSGIDRWAMGRRSASLMRRLAERLDPRRDPSLTDDAAATDFLRLADHLISVSRFDEADTLLAMAKSLYPWRPDLFTHYALCAQKRPDVAMTVVRWGDVVTRFPQYALSHYRLAAALRETGETERALEIIVAALPNHLDDVGMVSEAARVFATVRRWPDAVAQWDRAFALAHATPEWREARAHAVRMAANQ